MDDLRHSSTDLALTLALLGLGLLPRAELPETIGALHRAGSNRADVERQQHGYYETLLALGGNSRGAKPSAASGDGAVPFEAAVLAEPVADVRQYALRKGVYVSLPTGGAWTTNTQGRHDHADATQRTPGTVRVAMLGDSIGSAWGVDDAEGFAPRAIAELSARNPSRGGPAIELLNYAVPGHAPGQRWEDFVRQDGWAAGPDLLLYEATPADLGWDPHRLRGLLEQGLGFDSPQYAGALAAAGIRPGADFASYREQLRPHRTAILAGVYRTIARSCRERGVPTVWVLIPRVGEASDADPAQRAALLQMARAAGFDQVFDLSDCFDADDPRAIALGPGDYHPNAAGHRRLADRLTTILAGHPAFQTRPPGPVGPPSAPLAPGQTGDQP